MKSTLPTALVFFASITITAGGVPARNGTQSQLLQEIPAEFLPYIGGAMPDAHGLVGANRKGFVAAALQRGATLTLAVAAARGDQKRAEDCWRAVEVAFSHQTDEGNFGDPADSVAFWVCELSRSLLVIQESPLAGHFREKIAGVKPKLAKAARWLASHRDVLKHDDGQTPNRLFFDAEAFGCASLLLNDGKLLAQGREFLDLGLKLYRDSDGVFLEKDGGDSSYQAVCLLRLQEILLHLPDDRLPAIIAKGVQWELTRIGPDGAVSTEGNTRVHPGGEKFLGHEKAVNVYEINLALLYHHQRTGDKASLAAVERICKWIDARKREAR